MERKGIVTFAGDPLTLVGNEVKVGDRAPVFTALDKDLTEVKLSDFAPAPASRNSGPSRIIGTHPSDMPTGCLSRNLGSGHVLSLSSTRRT